jgi:hypothetical protein
MNILKTALPDSIVILGQDSRTGSYKVLVADFLECFKQSDETCLLLFTWRNQPCKQRG